MLEPNFITPKLLIMTIRMTTCIVFCALLFMNCTQEDYLITDVSIQQLPACDGSVEALIDININSGESPYILQVVRAADNTIIYDEKTNENHNTLSVPNLLDIDYNIIVKSSNFETTTISKEIFPTGTSSLEVTLQIETGDTFSPFANIPVTLYLSASRNPTEIAQLTTDNLGSVKFGSLPTSDYFLEFHPGEKYSNFKITAQDEEGTSIVSEDQYGTVLVPMICDNNKSLAIQYVKY